MNSEEIVTPRIITLTSDYGTDNLYAAAIKGAIIQRDPSIRIASPLVAAVGDSLCVLRDGRRAAVGPAGVGAVRRLLGRLCDLLRG